jgi:nicotinamidase-related amidase
MKRDVLCVIDMQDKFSTCGDNHRSIRQKVKAVVKEHVNRGDLIVIVEFNNWGPTNKGIERVAKKGEYVRVQKLSDGGGYEVYDAIKSNTNISEIGKVYMCGINSCACVKSTADQFANHIENGRFKDRTIVLKDACACQHDGNSNQKPYQETCFSNYPVKYL